MLHISDGLEGGAVDCSKLFLIVFIIAILVYKFQDFKRNLNKNPKETIIEGEFRNIDSDAE